MTLQSFPLCWPDGWTRTPDSVRKMGHFKSYGNRMTVATAITRITQKLGMMGIRKDDLIISTNLPLRLDGLPRSDQAEPRDRGVAVYWRKAQGAQMQCMAIDIYANIADNLAAVAATLEAMRAIERHGGAQIQERAYRGFAALPASTSRPWRDVLGFNAGEVSIDAIDARFKRLARTAHPDTGGSSDAMAELNHARDEALAELEP